MKNLADIPSGCCVFVDTNIFVYHFLGRSPDCTGFFRRIATEDIKAYVNTEVLSDLLHKLMLEEAQRRGFIANGNANRLKQRLLTDRTTIANMPNHQSLFESVLNIGVRVIRLSKKLLIDTKSERCTHGLMTNDSLHLGCMVYHTTPIDNIATRDGDFAHIPGITVWQPQDVIQ